MRVRVVGRVGHAHRSQLNTKGAPTSVLHHLLSLFVYARQSIVPRFVMILPPKYAPSKAHAVCNSLAGTAIESLSLAVFHSWLKIHLYNLALRSIKVTDVPRTVIACIVTTSEVTTYSQMYRVAQKVCHYRESSLNCIKTASAATFLVSSEYKCRTMML